MQYYVLASSLCAVQQTMMVLLYPCLHSKCSVLATTDAADDGPLFCLAGQAKFNFGSFASGRPVLRFWRFLGRVTSDRVTVDLMQELVSLLKQEHAQQQFLALLVSFYFGVFGLMSTGQDLMFFQGFSGLG